MCAFLHLGSFISVSPTIWTIWISALIVLVWCKRKCCFMPPPLFFTPCCLCAMKLSMDTVKRWRFDKRSFCPLFSLWRFPVMHLTRMGRSTTWTPSSRSLTDTWLMTRMMKWTSTLTFAAAWVSVFSYFYWSLFFSHDCHDETTKFGPALILDP